MIRIGVIIPAITDNLHNEILNGIHKTALASGCDVIVFTTATNGLEFNIQSEIMEGEESVYSLLEKAHIDCVLLVSQYFVKDIVRRRITDIIKRLSIPCIDLGGSELGFETVHTSQDRAFYKMTSHVIEKHHCRNLIFLAGFKGNPESELRMSGFISSADEHGCTYEIVYGDFWTIRPEELGNEIIQGKREIPDAVICANDIMAVTLCKTLQNGGIVIPDDIIITGYDGHISAISNFPSITTVINSVYELGCIGVIRVLKKIGVKGNLPDEYQSSIMYGASCGCVENMTDYQTAALKVQEQISRESNEQLMLEMRINADVITKTIYVESISELIGIVDESAHIINDYKSLHLCIIPDWDGNPETPDVCLTKPFPDKMLCAISKQAWQTGELFESFNTADIAPVLSKPHEPVLMYILPLHASSQVFGYCGFVYENAEKFKVSLMLFNFLSAVANGIRTLRHKLYAEYLQKKIEEVSLCDIMTDMLSKKGLLLYLENHKDIMKKSGIMIVTIAKHSSTLNTQKQNQMIDNVTQSELILANAIRLLSGKNLQTARLDKSTFAIVFPLQENEDINQTAETMLIQAEVFIRKIQESSSVIFFPEPYYVCGYIDSDSEDCLTTLWNQLESSQPKEKGFRGISNLKKIRHELHKAPELDWNLGDIAKRLNISRSYAQKLYKEHFGISFMDDIINTRIDMAKHLLSSTDLQVNEIASACGYQNSTHFMRQFKEKVGMSPSKFRG